MQSRFAIALGALSLGWLTGSALAAEPAPLPSTPQAVALDKPAAAPPAPAAPAPAAPAPITAAPVVLQPADAGCCDHECGHGSHLVGGAGFYVMKAFPGDDTALVTTTTTTTLNVLTGAFTSVSPGAITDFSHQYEVAPIVWLGYVSDSGLGMRVRWWHYDESNSLLAVNPQISGTPPPVVNGVITTTSTAISSASPLGLSFTSPNLLFGTNPLLNGPDQILAANKIRLNVWDFEATQDFKSGCWSLAVSAGVRYAMLSQSYTATRQGFTGLLSPASPLTDDVNADDTVVADTNSLIANHTINGVGPTASLDIRRPIGGRGLALYGTARGSILFGRNKQSAILLSHQQLGELDPTEADDTPPISTGASLAANHDQVMPVAEVEAGAEWSRQMGRIVPFVRVGIVAQTWFDAGSATSLNGDLGFFGMTFGAGLSF
jgi:hypothetical protein